MGKGIYYWNNGNKNEGDFYNGEINGKGIKYYNNGDKYDGNGKIIYLKVNEFIITMIKV